MSPSPLSEPIDLASNAVGGRVVYANDELFADRRHLIRPEPSAWQPGTYGPDGKIYDGWETRRRRDRHEGDHDFAIVRLGAPGAIRSIVVDTAHFRGNYPPFASIEATASEGYPIAESLPESAWTTLVTKSALKGDSANQFDVVSDQRWTHVRLSIHPDGGVARLRVLGDAVPDPRVLTGTIDLAGLVQGGRVIGCSDMFYSSAGNLIRPGDTATIAEGWETARRRDGGHEWVLFALAGGGRLRRAEIDTSHFTGNSPGATRLLGVDARVHGLDNPDAWQELLPRTNLRPDTKHLFRLGAADSADSADSVTHVRMEVFPDGGMSRVRFWGELDEQALDTLTTRWLGALPEAHLTEVLEGLPELSEAEAQAVRSRRPQSSAALPPALRDHLLP